MATLSRGQSFGSTETITNTKLHNLVDLATITNIVDADIASNAQIQFSKLLASSIDGSLLNNLGNIGSGAGKIPFANMNVPFGSSYVSLVSIPGTSLCLLASLASAAGIIPQNNINTGRNIQVVNISTGAVATGSTVIPFDDTIPQNTEGDEYFTLAITPTKSTNLLKIEVLINLFTSSGDELTAALFQDATANALTASSIPGVSFGQIKLIHYMTAGTTSSTTFKVRAGANSAGTTTVNGANGARKLGGVSISSMTITEVKA